MPSKRKRSNDEASFGTKGWSGRLPGPFETPFKNALLEDFESRQLTLRALELAALQFFFPRELLVCVSANLEQGDPTDSNRHRAFSSTVALTLTEKQC